MSDDYGHEVFRSRAIKPEVAHERGYRRYGDENGLDPIFEADARFKHPDEGGARFRAPWDGRWHSFYNWSMHKVRGTTGWVMPKHALPGSAFDGPLAQLRPDDAIPGRRYAHDHSDMGDIVRVLHEEGKRHRDPDTGKLLIPVKGVHEHVEQAKYLLPPGPYGKRWDGTPVARLTLSTEPVGCSSILKAVSSSTHSSASGRSEPTCRPSRSGTVVRTKSPTSTSPRRPTTSVRSKPTTCSTS